ncbi:MAG TPA: SpoIIE family protein phosphatase, partial [Candidatus Cybelea sp.]|nr:SpoIIE family protein phosphatase [Candidatus Cybelea sp.]
MVATEVADACAIVRLHGDTLRTEILVHRDPKLNAAIAPLRGHRTLRLQPERELALRLKRHETIVLTEDSLRLRERSWPYLGQAIEALNACSTIIVPWYASSATYGALIAHYSAPSVDADDVALLEEVARRASVAVERAEALERERKIATTLQQASLPALIAEPQGLTFDAVYAPAGEEAEVGGDWYDAIELDDGSVVVSVGDVTGRGIQAAAIMSKVRHAMGMAPLHETDPTKILDSAGWFLSKRYPEAIVTAFVAIISPDRRSMRFANAGHPLPILRRDGSLIELRAVGLPLGLRQMAKPEASGEIALRDGDIILFFTDGLIEGRREWDIGESMLRSVLQSDLFTAASAPAKLVARSCLPATLHDDVAILAVSVAPPRAWSLSFDDARAAWDARSHFVEFLRGVGSSERLINTAELVFGELLSNVVCHAPGPVEVSLDCHDDRLVLHVVDSGPPIEVTDWRLPEDTLSERGR